MLRRRKEDVTKDIPPKEETIIDVELTMVQKKYYRAIYERNHSVLNKVTCEGGGGGSVHVEGCGACSVVTSRLLACLVCFTKVCIFFFCSQDITANWCSILTYSC